MSPRAELPLGSEPSAYRKSCPAPSATTTTAHPCLEHRPMQAREEPARSVEGERHLRDEDEVGVVHGQRGVAGDEAAVPAHDPHQADTVDRGLGLDPRGLDRLRRGRVRGLEAEALADERDVVVDGLRDADDGDVETARQQDVGEAGRAAHRPVAADDEQDVDAEVDEAVGHHLGVLGAPRAAEDGAALLVDRRDRVRGERDRGRPRPGTRPAKPCRNPTTSSTRVVRVELEDEPADDVVEAGAEAAAGDDADPRGAGLEEDPTPGAARFERRELVEGQLPRAQQLHRVVEEHPVVLVDVVLVGAAPRDVLPQRRVEPALAEAWHLQLRERGHPASVLPACVHRVARVKTRGTRPGGRPEVGPLGCTTWWPSRSTPRTSSPRTRSSRSVSPGTWPRR